MTGPEHYKKAEEILRAAFDESNMTEKSYLVSLAGVHATLALAAATAANDPDPDGHGQDGDIKEEWFKVIAPAL